MNDAKIYFENPFITRLITRDENNGITEHETFIAKIVKNYLDHEMVTSISNFN
jgi:hypothetical protein